MNILDNLVDIKVKNDMGIYGFTDEFFCVYLYNLFNKTNKSLLVVCDSINEANNIIYKLFKGSNNILGILIRGKDYIAKSPSKHPITPKVEMSL